MRWRQFLTPVKNMTVAELRDYVGAHQEGSYTLLDVRQGPEYEKAHLPGARLIPLPELTERLEELDPQKPVIAY